MRTSRRVAIGCLVVALGAGGWWMARRSGDAPAPDEATGTEDVARRPEAQDGVHADSRGGAELSGAAPASAAVDGDDASDVVVLVVGPDGPLRGAEVRLAEYVKEIASVEEAANAGERPDRRGWRPGMSGHWWTLGPDRLGSTDAAGRCRFRNVRREFGEVSASAPGFLRGGGEERFMRRAPRGLAEVRVTLLAATRLEGTVVDAGTGMPIVGARVGFGLSDGMAGGRYGHSYVDSTQTAGPDGRFTLWAPTDAASLSVEVSASEHVGAAVEVRNWRGHLDPERPVIRLPRFGAIEGVVLDPDGRPLASATVSIGEVESATPPSDAASIGNADDWTGPGGKVAPPTGADGTFAFTGLARGGRFRLRATAEGLPPLEREMTLEFGSGAVRVDLRFAPATAIAVRVLGPDGRPFPSTVAIVVTSAGLRQERKAWNSLGRYLFDRVSPGAVRVRVVAPSGAADEQSVDAQVQSVAEVTLRLPVAGAIRGEVVDAEGRRVEDATVSCAGRDTRTDANGRFEFTDVAPGEHTIAARAKGTDDRQFATVGRLIVRAPTEGVRVVVHRLARVRMGVVGSDAKAVPGRVAIRLCEPGTHPSGAVGSFTQPSRVGGGTYEFETGVAAGAYDLLVDSSGFAILRRSVTFRAGEDLDLGEIRLESGVELSGRVLDVSGAPVAGATVRAIDAGARARTAADGRFRLSHVAPGTVALGVEIAGATAARVSVDAADGGDPCEIRLAGPGLVRGAVRGADGRPRAGVRIRFVHADDAEAPPVDATSSRIGRVFVVLPPGTWNATFTSSGGRAVVLAAVTVASDAVKTVDLTLPND